MNKNVEIIQGGLKCDNTNCDWLDTTIKVEDYEKWLNAPCPKCGENVLTEQDYMNVQALLLAAELCNGIPKDVLKELGGTVDIETLKNKPMFADTEGFENLKGDPGKKVLISFDTHKEIKAKEIKPTNKTHT